jgi:hypothetical protein
MKIANIALIFVVKAADYCYLYLKITITPYFVVCSSRWYIKTETIRLDSGLLASWVLISSPLY